MYEKLSKRARGCMLVNEIIAGVILTAVICAIWFGFFSKNFPMGTKFIILALVLIWALCIIAPFVRYERYRYRFTDEEIDVKEGFLFVSRDIVPIERLHKVSMQSGPIDRIFGLSKVVVTTAGGDVTIRFLETVMAEKIVDTLKTRINSYAVQEKQNKVEKGETGIGEY